MHADSFIKYYKDEPNSMDHLEGVGSPMPIANDEIIDEGDIDIEMEADVNDSIEDIQEKNDELSPNMTFSEQKKNKRNDSQ